MTPIEDLKRLQKLQADYIGILDINIETRNDQQTTMFSLTNYPISRKFIVHKLKWNIDNEDEFKKIESEIIKLTK